MPIELKALGKPQNPTLRSMRRLETGCTRPWLPFKGLFQAVFPSSLSADSGLSSNMLLVLLYLAALSQTVASREEFQSSTTIDISACPIYFFGQRYNNLYIAFNFRKFSAPVVRIAGYTSKTHLVDLVVRGVILDKWNVLYIHQAFRGVTQKASVYSAVNRRTSQCPSTCTVIGSTVIRFDGNVTSIPNRCTYSLMSHRGVRLEAVFKDRRRKDISFLDQVILYNSGVSFHLGQGGRVQVNDTVLSLSDVPQQLHGVKLSKDKTGVTAMFPLSKVSVFFDGYTAQITTPGGFPSMQGLCGNRTLSDMKSASSSSSCEVLHRERNDTSINCTMVTERCNVLREAPFTACHNLTDPEPFITACTSNLCKYPVVDGFSRCQFLEAYVAACNLQPSNKTLQGWRSKANCSAPKVICNDTFCSPHEFCAVDISGKTSCFCRAIFASKYRSRNTLGEPTVCDNNSATVTLAGCLLNERGVDYSMLHLNNNSCRGEMDNKTHMLTFSFDSNNTCGTVVMANNSQIIYKNSIMKQNNTGVITRHDQFQIDFSCYYNQPEIKTMAFKIRNSSVIQKIISGPWNYTLTMKAYSDAGRTKAINASTEIQLQQKVFVELKTEGLDDQLVSVVTDSCWATDQSSPNGSLRYDLIMKGCSNPADDTVTVIGNGLGTFNYFSFNMFQFTGKNGDIYLHCRLNLCVKNNNTCAPKIQTSLALCHKVPASSPDC
ncbi:alpha-tectorin-like [Seriola dumerili]|uniref:alpha-tectorin-like n=1 Tax=Seriola dumerili TaxID=41447 RepID=UPI000BBE17CF|nr:alpha-tectorin-like [Seriola dumerili]